MEKLDDFTSKLIGFLPILSMILYGGFGISWWKPVPDNEGIRYLYLFLIHVSCWWYANRKKKILTGIVRNM